MRSISRFCLSLSLRPSLISSRNQWGLILPLCQDVCQRYSAAIRLCGSSCNIPPPITVKLFWAWFSTRVRFEMQLYIFSCLFFFILNKVCCHSNLINCAFKSFSTTLTPHPPKKRQSLNCYAENLKWPVSNWAEAYHIQTLSCFVLLGMYLVIYCWIFVKQRETKA